MSYLSSQGVSLKDLEKQYKGRKFGELVLHQISQQSINKICLAIEELEKTINPLLKETTEMFLETIVYSFSKTKKFWQLDCGEALILYTNSTKSESKKFGIDVSDDYAFDIFNLIVLTLAKKAMQESDFKKFIKNSVKLFGIF